MEVSRLEVHIVLFDIRYPETQKEFSIGIEKNTVVDLEEGTSSIFHSFLGSWYVDLTAGEGNVLQIPIISISRICEYTFQI